MKYVKWVFLLIVFSISIISCSGQNKIIGTWGYYFEDSLTQILKFNADGSYSIYSRNQEGAVEEASFKLYTFLDGNLKMYHGNEPIPIQYQVTFGNEEKNNRRYISLITDNSSFDFYELQEVAIDNFKTYIPNYYKYEDKLFSWYQENNYWEGVIEFINKTDKEIEQLDISLTPKNKFNEKYFTQSYSIDSYTLDYRTSDTKFLGSIKPKETIYYYVYHNYDQEVAVVISEKEASSKKKEAEYDFDSLNVAKKENLPNIEIIRIAYSDGSFLEN